MQQRQSPEQGGYFALRQNSLRYQRVLPKVLKDMYQQACTAAADVLISGVRTI